MPLAAPALAYCASAPFAAVPSRQRPHRLATLNLIELLSKPAHLIAFLEILV
jgi:hypothetical protein